MSFTIKLQVNKSERERLDKDLDTLFSLDGTLRDTTSIIDPIIIMEVDLEQVKKCNYVTISAFGRSYFVNNIRSIRDGFVEFSCHVDVLTTYKSQIRNNTAIVKKQEKDWNLYLNDGSLKVYQNPKVMTKSFPSGFSTQEIVLAVAGG